MNQCKLFLLQKSLRIAFSSLRHWFSSSSCLTSVSRSLTPIWGILAISLSPFWEYFLNFSPTQNVYLRVESVKGLLGCLLERFGSLPVDYSYFGISASLNFEFRFGSELDSVPWFLLKDELDADWSSKSSFLSQTHRARGDDEEKKWEGPPLPRKTAA